MFNFSRKRSHSRSKEAKKRRAQISESRKRQKLKLDLLAETARREAANGFINYFHEQWTEANSNHKETMEKVDELKSRDLQQEKTIVLLRKSRNQVSLSYLCNCVSILVLLRRLSCFFCKKNTRAPNSHMLRFVLIGISDLRFSNFHNFLNG